MTPAASKTSRERATGPGKVDKHAAKVEMRTQELGEHRARSAADVDDRTDAVPATGELQCRTWRPVARVAHQRVEISRNVLVRVQVLPERRPKHVRVARFAGFHEGRQGAPRMRHPAADTVKAEERAGTEQAARWVIECEPSERLLDEETARDQVRQHAMQRAGIGTRRSGERIDIRDARVDVFRDTQRGDDPDAPRSREVAQRPEVDCRFPACHRAYSLTSS